jgi:hypothetical protein
MQAVQKQPEAWDECQKYQKLVEEYKQEKDQVAVFFLYMIMLVGGARGGQGRCKSEED